MSDFIKFPADLQTIWDRDTLDREFLEGLEATLAFAEIASTQPFAAGVGETTTATRAGLYPLTNVTPLTPAQLYSDQNNGMTPMDWNVEQFTMKIAQYGNMAQPLDVNSVGTAIDDAFAQSSYALGEHAGRFMDTLARNALYSAYTGGNSFVLDTLGAPATELHVDNIIGFDKIYLSTTDALGNDMYQPVSPTYPMNVTISTLVNPIGTIYSCVGAVPDVTNISSTLAIGGVSGTLTFASSVIVLDGTEGNGLVGQFAPVILRQGGEISPFHITGTDILTMKTLRDATIVLRNNNVPGVNGGYNIYLTPESMGQIFDDTEFQTLYSSNPKSRVYKEFGIIELLDLTFIVSNMNPIFDLNGQRINRPIVCGRDVMVRGESSYFLAGNKIQSAPNNDTVLQKYIKTKNGITIAMTVRPPTDMLKKIYNQAWQWVGGHVIPTDLTATNQIIPTATNSYFKRAVVIETA